MTGRGVEVSVVIPAHNAAVDIVEQLDAVARSIQTVPHSEVIVVDNMSTDNTADVVLSWASTASCDLRIVEANDRAGEPHARNVGWKAANGALVLFCDADDVVSESWAPALAAALAHAEYASGPVGTDELNPDWMAEIRGSIYDTRSSLYGAVPYAHGCNMAFRRSTLERLGGFDENFLIACDIEIAVRAWRAGLDLAFADGALVQYRLREDLWATYRQGRSYGRWRWRIAEMVPELIDRRTERRKRVRRIGWLARRSLSAITDRSTRGRWVWVLSQVDGEFRGWWERRRE